MSHGSGGPPTDAPIDAPSRSDRFVGGLSQPFGGPVGDHAVREPATGWPGRFWNAGRIALALTVITLVAHWLQKSPCRQSETWVDQGQLRRFCYSDITALYGAEGGLSTGGLPYLDYPLEYPVLIGYLMSILGWPVHALGEVTGINETTWFYDLHVVVLGALAVASVAVIVALRRRRPWDAAMFAVAPALLLSATVNWDLLAVIFAVGGLLAWSRGRPVAAGILLGLGTAAKLWPGFVFLPILLLALRHRQLSVGVRVTLIGIGTWVVANLPAVLGDYLSNGNIDNWLRFLQLNTERAIDWGTFWYVGRYLDVHLLGGSGPFQYLSDNVDPVLNYLTYALFALACAGIGWLVYRAPEPPRLAALALLVVAAFLLTNKVWSQQFVLWLLPLVVLARPRWGLFVAWQVAEVAYFFTFYGQLLRVTPEDQRPEDMFVMPEGWFILAASLRWVTVALLCAAVVYEILHPRRDVVRAAAGGADPDDGVFAPTSAARDPGRRDRGRSRV